MPDGDAIDDLLVFRRPGTPEEDAVARGLLGGEPGRGSDRRDFRVYVLVDIGRPGRTVVVAAAEVWATSQSWRVLRAGGEGCQHARLATDLVRAATAAGAARLTVAPDAPRGAWHLLRTVRREIVQADGGLSLDL